MRHLRLRSAGAVRLAVPALIILLSVSGYAMARGIVRHDERRAEQRRAEQASVQTHRALDRARAFVAGLGRALEAEPAPRAARFAQLEGIAAPGADLTDALWVEQVTASGRAAYERRIGRPITVRVGSGPVRRAPDTATHLPVTFATGTARRQLPPGRDVVDRPALSTALRARASTLAVAASGRGSLGGRSGFYVVQAGRFGRGPGSRGYLAVFVPSRWLTVTVQDDPRRVAISLDGRPLERGLDAAPAASARFATLARRWRVDVAAEPMSSLHAALPWMALGWPIVVAGLVYALGRGLRRRRRAEREVERIFELSVDLLGVVDRDGYFTRVNPAFERTLGFTTAELLARPFMEFVHPDDRAPTETAFAAVLGGESLREFENRYLRADGSVCWLQWSTTPAPEEGLMYATARDVTESRRTRDELRRAQRLVEASRDELRVVADEQAALRRVATLVARGEPPGRIFDAVVDEVGRLLGADSSGLMRYEPDGTGTLVSAWGDVGNGVQVGGRVPAGPGTLPGEVQAEGRALRRDSGGAGTEAALAARLGAMGLRTIIGAPVAVEGRLWGLIATAWHGDDVVPQDAEERMGQFTELVATTIANAEGRAELAASRARIVAASDAARRRIERDLHDGAQQRLVSLALGLRGAEGALGPEHERVRAQLQHTADGLDHVLEDLQEMSRGIHPAILSKGGLGPALRTLARRSAVPVELDVDAGGRLPEPVEVAAYYVVSEALANAAKHAQASVVHVDVEAQDGFLSLVVEDDGVGGVDPAQGSGLTGLRDRVEALGGRFEVVSGPGRGTALKAQIPVPPPPLR